MAAKISQIKRKVMIKTAEKYKILIVEDDPSMLSFWKRFLAELEISQHSLSTNAQEAKVLLEQNKYELIISDIVIPGGNGYEVAAIAKRKNPAIRIILTSAYEIDPKMFNHRKKQFHILQKPFSDLKELKNLVTSLIKNADVLEEADSDAFVEDSDYPEVIRWSF